jgi:spermidine/putrescine transport system permease protein
MTRFRDTFKRELPFLVGVPALVWHILFLYIPICYLIVLGITRVEDGSTVFAFSRFTEFFQTAYLKVLGRSLFLAFGNALLCVCVGYPVAYCLAVKFDRWRNLMLMFLMLPFWTNFLVQVYAWFFVLERHGVLNTILMHLGIISTPLYIINTTKAIWLIMLYCYLPFAIMPMYAVLEKFDVTLLDASYDLGATPWQTFLRITLPLSMSGVMTGFFLVFIPSFGELVVPSLAGGDKQMFVGSLISHYFLTAGDEHAGAAFTCLSALLLGSVAIIIHKYMQSRVKRIR